LGVASKKDVEEIEVIEVMPRKLVLVGDVAERG
jgi:hypothetical protein